MTPNTKCQSKSLRIMIGASLPATLVSHWSSDLLIWTTTRDKPLITTDGTTLLGQTISFPDSYWIPDSFSSRNQTWRNPCRFLWSRWRPVKHQFDAEDWQTLLILSTGSSREPTWNLLSSWSWNYLQDATSTQVQPRSNDQRLQLAIDFITNSPEGARPELTSAAKASTTWWTSMELSRVQVPAASFGTWNWKLYKTQRPHETAADQRMRSSVANAFSHPQRSVLHKHEASDCKAYDADYPC